MKRIVAILVIVGWLLVGCTTTGVNGNGLDASAVAHDVGYAATAAYFYQKNKGTGQDYIKAAELAYQVLTFIVEEDEEVSVNIEDYVIKLVSERTDDPDTRIASTALVRLYGKRLRSRLNWEGLPDSGRLSILKDFYKGIESAIEDLEPILGDAVGMTSYDRNGYVYYHDSTDGEVSTVVQ